MACHARRRPSVCAAKGPCWHVKPNVVRPCVLSKGNDGIKYPTSSDRVCCTRVMVTCHIDVVPPCVLLKGDIALPRPTSSNRVCTPRAMITCPAQCRPIVYVVQGRSWMSCPTLSDRRRWNLMADIVRPPVLPYGDDGMPRPTSSYRVCCPWAMWAFHVRLHLIMCAV
ncbi:hypothetical protein EJD97_007457 [Solanum chilense]|uniref:Uncharacterized protein n=1 Tax=Solanum chilense TaxID=4083 RepID=A0A6N2AJP4_SOLCI|nr:hypothetical protein EJD97_007457 [Solanum chilense]